MSDFNPNSLSTLDKVRTSRGSNELSDFFNKLLRSSPRKAVSLLNEDNLSFPSLFLLKRKISSTPIHRYLNTRNKNTLMLTNAIISKNFSNFSRISKSIGDETPSILRWILVTGKDEYELRNQYNEVLDSCALILVREYKDTSILPFIKDIIYNRNRKGMFIHDLVWAFFESRNPNSIMMLAEGLNSADKNDIDLSRKLLKFIPVTKNNSPEEMQYLNILYWFKDNYPFLYYTGESFQQKPNPAPFEVSYTGKYLCRKVFIDSSRIEGTLSEDELGIMDQFDGLDEKSKLLLSNYSYILHSQNIYWWNNWIHSPINEQLKIASDRLGGTPCL